MDNLKLEDWGGMEDHTPPFLSPSTLPALTPHPAPQPPSSESNPNHPTINPLIHPAISQNDTLKPRDVITQERLEVSEHSYNWIKTCIISLIIINMFLAYDALSSLPYFQIQELQFHNLKRLQKKELLKDLNFEKLHLNYFFVDTDFIADHLKSHAWIQNAVVERVYPNQLQAFIQEKQAVAVTALSQLTAIDQTGAPIAAISAKEATELPLISGVSHEFFAEGGDQHIGQRLLLRGLEVAQLYQQSDIPQLRALSEVYVSETGRIELMLQQTRVSLGTKDFSSALRHLNRILKHLKKRGVDASYILLSEDQTRAIVKEIPLKIDTTP